MNGTTLLLLISPICSIISFILICQIYVKQKEMKIQQDKIEKQIDELFNKSNIQGE